MSDEAPTPGNMIHRLLDYCGLACILIAPEELVREHSWRICLDWLLSGILFLVVNHLVGPKIKMLVLRAIAWLRNSKALAAALETNANLQIQINELKANRPPSLFDVIQARHPASSAPPTQYPKPNFGKLTIHSARWVVRDDDRHFIDAEKSLRGHIKQSLIDTIDIALVNENLGGEPLYRTHKVLKLTYSYGENGAQQKIIKHEGGNLVLPELPDSRIPELDILLGMERAEVALLREQMKTIAEAKRKEWPHLTVERETADLPTTNPKITYKNKLRVIIKNDSGKEIQVWAPLWDESSEVMCDSPLGSLLQLAGPRGWVEGDWLEEQSCLKVAPKANFRCWIGLMPPSGDSIERRVPHQRNGTLIFPIKVENKLLEARVKV